MEVININSAYKSNNQNTEISISEIPFSTILNDLFMKGCSKFYSFDALVYHCDYSVISKDEFLALPIDTIDTYIRNYTAYDSWEEMFGDAVSAYVEKNLGK